jgi:carbon-monoxide dehydrogenase medium subunit
MKPFQYFEPASVEEAISLSAKHKEEAKVIAGGTDLVVQMMRRMAKPQYIINMGAIPDLNYIDYDGEKGLKIGALTTIAALEKSPEIRQRHPVIAQAASTLGSIAIRNVATVGGNLCNAAPSADMAPPLLGLSATAKIVGPTGEKTVLLEDFFTGPGSTILGTGELLLEIQVPLSPPRTGGVYLKHATRKFMDLAIVGVAAVITLSSDEVCRDVKIVLGAVAPTPIRVQQAENAIKNKMINEEKIQECAMVAAEEASPISDVRASAEYRKEMVKVFTRNAVRRALEVARGA